MHVAVCANDIQVLGWLLRGRVGRAEEESALKPLEASRDQGHRGRTREAVLTDPRSLPFPQVLCVLVSELVSLCPGVVRTGVTCTVSFWGLGRQTMIEILQFD